jgi:uncharacterized protein (DUF1330 family)
MPLPTPLNETLVRDLPDNGPVVMVNFLRFRERSIDGDWTGWDAYVRYSANTVPMIKALGGAILWSGNPEGVAFGDPSTRLWDYIVLVRYPSRAAFLSMVTSPDYARGDVHRENGVEDHLILASTETYSKFGVGGDRPAAN